MTSEVNNIQIKVLILATKYRNHLKKTQKEHKNIDFHISAEWNLNSQVHETISITTWVQIEFGHIIKQ